MTRDDLVGRAGSGAPLDFIFFWRHTPEGEAPDARCLSQWSGHGFVVENTRYSTAEHWMMAEKARVFSDDGTRAKILAAKHPKDVKALGRLVKGYVGTVWEAARFDVVVRGNRAKFTQNAALGRYLASTAPKVLVEASPVDSVWGIGLAAEDPLAKVPVRWPGLNLLGFALMAVRDTL